MTRRAARPPITGWPSLLCSQARLEGYRAALERAGAPAGPSLVYSGDVHFDAALVAATDMLEPAGRGRRRGQRNVGRPADRHLVRDVHHRARLAGHGGGGDRPGGAPGGAALFLACRGPAQRIIGPFGPRLGLTEARLRRAAPAAWTEAVCLACVGVSLLAERVPGLAGLARLDPVDPGRPAGPGGPEPGDEPKVLVR
jgi:hypothetical protein